MGTLTDLFKALSDPTRRRILILLRERDMNAGEIADNFPVSKPSISHHLAQLKQAGLVSDTRKGQNIVYSLETTALQDLMSWVLSVRDASVRKEAGDHDQI